MSSRQNQKEEPQIKASYQGFFFLRLPHCCLGLVWSLDTILLHSWVGYWQLVGLTLQRTTTCTRHQALDQLQWPQVTASVKLRMKGAFMIMSPKEQQKTRLTLYKNTALSFVKSAILIITMSAFLMHWIPLWLHMCEGQSAVQETLQQYTTCNNALHRSHPVPPSPPQWRMCQGNVECIKHSWCY